MGEPDEAVSGHPASEAEDSDWHLTCRCSLRRGGGGPTISTMDDHQRMCENPNGWHAAPAFVADLEFDIPNDCVTEKTSSMSDSRSLPAAGDDLKSSWQRPVILASQLSNYFLLRQEVLLSEANHVPLTSPSLPEGRSVSVSLMRLKRLPNPSCG